jgi:membrane protease YdiL (CAAX protease family)
MVLLEGGLIAAMAVVAHLTFARRLKGFGLNVRTIGRDAAYAMVYLLAVYPLILFALWAVLTVGQLVKDDFSIEVHQSLTFLGENGNAGLTALVVVFAVVIVPIFEEMLFRGFLQTTLRSLTARPWAAIFLTSALFSLLHPLTHVPALFCLSIGLGYAYERSGSLFRPIFMHIFFNGISVAATFWMS